MSKILVKSAWGADDPTKSAFPFLHANALAKAGHEGQIFLLGEATPLMRTGLLEAIHPGRPDRVGRQDIDGMTLTTR